MIPRFEPLNTPRRVTIIPAVPAPVHHGHARLWATVAVGLALILITALQLGAQAAGAAADSTRPARVVTNWLSDRRSFTVGDILQIRIDEYAFAEANKDNTNSASRRRILEVGATPPSLPGSSSPLTAVDASVSSGDGGESRQRGNASRDIRYVGEIAVRVIAVTPEGLLQVRGTKTIDADRNKATLVVAGFVRPIDVGPRDIVRSELIADAQISYQASGSLGKPKNGILTRILGLFWP
ncbi:MAG: flagellar basal body L-ring protein FlgH [Gemmatimonadota bacterium]